MDVEQELKLQLAATTRELQTVYTSMSWRLGTVIVRAIRFPLRIFGLTDTDVGLAHVEVKSWSPRISGTVNFEKSKQDSVHVVLSIDGVDAQDVTVLRKTNDPVTDFELKYPISEEIQGPKSVKIRHTGRGPHLQPDSTTEIPHQLERARLTIKEIVGSIDGLRRSLESGRPLAIISSFRPPNRSLRSLEWLIHSFREAEFDVVVVDTSEDPKQRDVEELRRLCSLYIERENVGWDFASWLSVLAEFPWIETESTRLVLTNDSNFGPTFPIKDLFVTAEEKLSTSDVWGITESHQHEPHIQSYFMVFEVPALRSRVLTRFASDYCFPTDKQSIILSGEIALTNALRDADLRISAILPYSNVVTGYSQNFERRLRDMIEKDAATKFRASAGLLAGSYPVNFALSVRDDIRNGVPLNPTHHFWDIILDLGSPFIKRELVLKNPIPVPGIREKLMEVVPQPLIDIINEEIHPLGK